VEAVKEKLIEHDYAIKQIATSMHDIAENAKESNSKLGVIAESMTKQEVILEKLANLETNSKESINRVHKRIDLVESEVKKYSERGEAKGCTALQLLQERENTADIEIGANVKSNQKRLDKLDSIVTWVSRTVIGTLITGTIGLLFYIVKG